MTLATMADTRRDALRAEVAMDWVVAGALRLLPADARMATAARDRDVQTPEMATAKTMTTMTRINKYLQHVPRAVRQMHFYELAERPTKSKSRASLKALLK